MVSNEPHFGHLAVCPICCSEQLMRWPWGQTISIAMGNPEPVGGELVSMLLEC